jgi:SAM-dependent methyltransferase
VVDFARFDSRHYRTVGVAEGYGAWYPTYEATVLDAMDLALLARVESVDWRLLGDVADLGCGTGRTAAWLVAHGASGIDGVDITPEMLELAQRRAVHRSLRLADVAATDLPDAAYDLVICSLVDEHLWSLDPLYSEARRLLRTTGTFVVVGFHPYFVMAVGMPTHFESDSGEPVAIETYVHLPSEHFAAGRRVSLTPRDFHEGVVDDTWIAAKPTWERYRDWPISFVWVWAPETGEGGGGRS